MKNNQKKAIIIGAGPAGLACAYELLTNNSGIKPIIIEKLPVVGGISRTVYKDKLGVDIGGHRLHTNNEYIKSIWLKFLTPQNKPSIDDLITNRKTNYPKEGKDPNKENDVMLIRRRFSSIIYDKKFFAYPLKFNLETFKKLGLKTTFLAGVSYIKSTIFKREEKSLEDFMITRFGVVLYNIFFKDYTKKVWGKDANELSSEWGHERIRKLSLFKTIINSILSSIKFLKFKKETSLIDEFYYPKYGCSDLWVKMANFVVQNGGEIYLESEFINFNTKNDRIIELKYKDKNGNIQEITGNYFISCAPIKELITALDAPYDIKQHALNLPYRDYILASFYTNKFNLKNETDYPTINNITPDCWIYLQERDAIAARIQIMNNWSPYLVENFKKNYLVSLEYFINENEDFWKHSDEEILDFALKECKKYNLFDKKDILKSFVVKEKKAYPSYYGSYQHIDKIKAFLSTIENLYLIGRNGQHKYNNMDEAMLSGIIAASKIKDKKNEK